MKKNVLSCIIGLIGFGGAALAGKEIILEGKSK